MVHITQCAINTSAHSKTATRGRKHKKKLIQSIEFHIDNFELQISFWFGSAYPYSQTKNTSFIYITLYSIHSKYVAYTQELSKPETSQGGRTYMKNYCVT